MSLKKCSLTSYARTIGVKDGRGPARRYRCEQHRNKDNRVMGVLCDWDLTMITQKFEDDGNTPQCLSRLHSQVEVSSRERLRDRSPGEGRRDQVASPQAPARSPPWSLTCDLAAGAPLRARPESVFAWVCVVLDLLCHTFGHLAVWEQDWAGYVGDAKRDLYCAIWRDTFHGAHAAYYALGHAAARHVQQDAMCARRGCPRAAC